MTEYTTDQLETQLQRALDQVANPQRPAKPSEARPDGKRVFPNVPCLTDGCAGDRGHEDPCAPLNFTEVAS